MDLMLNIVKGVIFLEIIMIFLIIIITYALMVIYDYKTKVKEKITEKVTAYFATLIPEETNVAEFNFPKEWQRIDIIVPVLYKFTKLIQDKSWEETRLRLIRTILIPLARNAATNRDWIIRYFAAEAFGLVYTPEDEKFLIELVKDNHPLIRINALNAAIMRGSESAIQTIINEMAIDSWLTQSIYLQAFDSAPTKTRDFIIEYLLKTNDSLIRATCYNILLRYPMGKINWDIEKDIRSEDLKLRLSAIRYLSYVDSEQAIPILLALLSDPHWQARTIAIYTINNLRYLEAIPQIRKSLDDSNEWVRLYANQTLNYFQQEGLGIIRTRDINEEKAMFDVALQVLDT